MVVDLNKAGGRLVSTLRERSYPGIEISYASTSGFAVIVANPAEIEQVFLDLAAAAAGALSAGDQLFVEISRLGVADSFAELCLAVPMGNYVVLSIKDTGQGGEETEADLKAAHRLIVKNGGAVSVHRLPGVGSVIRLMFPEAVTAELPTPALKPETPRSGTETVLLVEDEAQVRQYLRKLLIGQGYEVLDAAHGADAAMLASRYRGSIELLLTDMALPGLTGMEIVDSITALRPGIAVLRMSGHAGGFGDSFDSSANCIQKPFRPAALLTRIRALLDAVPPAPLPAGPQAQSASPLPERRPQAEGRQDEIMEALEAGVRVTRR